MLVSINPAPSTFPPLLPQEENAVSSGAGKGWVAQNPGSQLQCGGMLTLVAASDPGSTGSCRDMQSAIPFTLHTLSVTPFVVAEFFYLKCV